MIVATIDYPIRRPTVVRPGRLPAHDRIAAPAVPKAVAAPRPAPPKAAPKPTPKPAPKPAVPDLPTPKFANWNEAMARDRLNALPITDMRSGGYDSANTAWMDRAFHPTQEVHPNEQQRRNLRRQIAENRILDIANGNKRNRLQRAGVTAPSNQELLRDYAPPPDPDGGKNPWYNNAEATRRKWHVYKKLTELERAAKIQPYSTQHALDAYLAKGGTLQGYHESFSEGLGQSLDCRRDRFGACMTDGILDSTQYFEPAEGEAGGVQPGGGDPVPDPITGSLQRSSVGQDYYTLQQYLGPLPDPRGSLQTAEPRPGPRGSLQTADPSTPTGVSLSRSSSSSQNQSAGTSAASAMSTAASTHFASSSGGNVSGYDDPGLGFSLRDITRPIERLVKDPFLVPKKVLDPFEFRKGPAHGLDRLADFADGAASLADFVGPIASAIPHPYAQGAGAAATTAADIYRGFTDGQGDFGSDLFSLLQRLGSQPLSPPVAPPAPPPPPAPSPMQTALPWLVGAGALTAGLLVMGRK